MYCYANLCNLVRLRRVTQMEHWIWFWTTLFFPIISTLTAVDSFFLLLIFKMYSLIYFLQSGFYPRHGPYWLFHIPHTPTPRQPIAKRMSPTNYHPKRPVHILGPQESWLLDISSVTVFRPCSPLLYSIAGLISAAVGWVVGGSVYERSQGFRLIVTAGLLMGLPSPQLLPVFP